MPEDQVLFRLFQDLSLKASYLVPRYDAFKDSWAKCGGECEVLAKSLNKL